MHHWQGISLRLLATALFVVMTLCVRWLAMRHPWDIT